MKKLILRRNFCSRDKDLISMSREFLISMKNNREEQNFKNYLKDIKFENLVSELNEDNKKKTFWINIYNSFILQKLKNETNSRTLYLKSEFFEKKDIQISNYLLSFDDIEHKFLRRSQIKYLRGYLSFYNFFAPEWEKQLRLEKTDYRIHFALNCGARSCPPILDYESDKLEEQLEMAKKSFLYSDSVFLNNSELSQPSILKVSKIFFWYKGDFGGSKGILKIHRECGIIPSDVKDKEIIITFKKYDWEIQI
jgi:hypothetical protein